MNSKERCLSAIKMESSLDRLPFWPKLSNAYPKHQRSTFSEMSLMDIYDWLDCDIFLGIQPCIKEIRKNCSKEVIEKNNTRKVIYNTKSGETISISKFDEGSQSWHPVKMPIETLQDINIMIEWYEDCSIEIDEKILTKNKKSYEEIGNKALIFSAIGKSPLMKFVEFLAGIENSHYLLSDHKKEVEFLFDQIHEILLRKAQLLSDVSPADTLWLFENTSTTLISPDQFKKYCFKFIQEYGKIVEEAESILVLHMCGKLKALLSDLANINATAFEAFTSPPVGNTRFADGRKICSDKCLIGGTNANLWTKDSNKIIEEIEKDLQELPHHRGIIVTSAGVMPPPCEPETIKTVNNWVKSFKPNL